MSLVASFTPPCSCSRRVEFALEAGIAPSEAVTLAKSAGWDWSESAIARIVAMQPDGAFTARAPDGAALGIVTCVLWDDLAWLGSMVVQDAARRQGIGRALLRRAVAYAEERGARVIGLDATPEAQPLYEAEGFAPAWGESATWTRAGPPRPPTASSGEFAIYPVSSAELMELLRYDTPRFGAGRGRYLAALVAERPHQSFVAVHRKTGAFSGHALSTERGIGPLVADAPEAAAWLLHALESAGASARAVVPAWNPDAARVFADAGYVKGRSCVRMARGGELPGRPGARYAIGSWALG